jgi:hypothetical protein
VTVVVQIEVGIKALDRHIERLEAKLSFLIRSYDDDNDDDNNNTSTDLSDQYKKKIATIKQEIEDAIEQRQLAAASFSMRKMPKVVFKDGKLRSPGDLLMQRL